MTVSWPVGQIAEIDWLSSEQPELRTLVKRMLGFWRPIFDGFDIKVNGRVVAAWQAVRVNGGTEPDDMNRYAWSVTGRTRTRPPRGQRAGQQSGTIDHRYGDGAVALAAKILAAADLVDGGRSS